MGFFKKITKKVAAKVLPKPVASVVKKVARAVGQPALNVARAAVQSKITGAALGAGSFIPGPIGLGFKAGSLATKAIKTGLAVSSIAKKALARKPSVSMLSQVGMDPATDDEIAQVYANRPRPPVPPGAASLDYAMPWRENMSPFQMSRRTGAFGLRRRILSAQEAGLVEDRGMPGAWGSFMGRRVWQNRATGQWQTVRRRSKRATPKQLKKAIAMIKREKKTYAKILGVLGLNKSGRRSSYGPPPWARKSRRGW